MVVAKKMALKLHDLVYVMHRPLLERTFLEQIGMIQP